MDRDKDADVHSIVNGFIQSNKTALTNKIRPFDIDLEEALKQVLEKYEKRLKKGTAGSEND